MMIKAMNKPAAKTPMLRKSLMTIAVIGAQIVFCDHFRRVGQQFGDVFAFQGAFVLAPFKLSRLQRAAAPRWRLLGSSGDGLVARGRIGRARR